ncbi:MAG: hypothetical protein AAF672_15230, partial [Pseudomonadota bacterium]
PIARLETAQNLNLSAGRHLTGVLVTDVRGPLRRVGLRPGNIILSINGEQVTSSAEVEVLGSFETRNWRIDGINQGRRFTYRFRL